MKRPLSPAIIGVLLALSTGAHAADVKPVYRPSGANTPQQENLDREKRRGDKTGNGRRGDKTGNGFGDKTGNGFGDKTGNGFGDKTGNGFGDKTGNGFGDKTGNGFEEKSEESSEQYRGDKTGNGFGDKTGNGLNLDLAARQKEYELLYARGDKTGNGGYAMENTQTGELEPHDETYAREVLFREVRDWDSNWSREQILKVILQEIRAADRKLYNEFMISKNAYERLSTSIEAIEDEIGSRAFGMLAIPDSHDIGIDLSRADRRPRQLINWFNPGEISMPVGNKIMPFDLVLHDHVSVDRMKAYQQAWMDFHEISYETHRRLFLARGYAKPSNSLTIQEWTAQFFSQGEIDWSIREQLFPMERRR